MYAILTVMLLSVSGDLSNSHAVIPLVGRAEAPVIEKSLPVWEVLLKDNTVHRVEAVGMAAFGDLYIFSDDQDELVFAVVKEKFVLAKKLPKGTK